MIALLAQHIADVVQADTEVALQTALERSASARRCLMARETSDASSAPARSPFSRNTIGHVVQADAQVALPDGVAWGRHRPGAV